MKKVQTYKIYEYNELDVVNPVNLTKDEGDTKGDSKKSCTCTYCNIWK